MSGARASHFRLPAGLRVKGSASESRSISIAYGSQAIQFFTRGSTPS